MSLDVRGLRVRLGRNEVLRGASFAATPGEVVALVGPNGAGKSTLLRGVAGLVRPHEGSVTWRGLDLVAMPPRPRAQHVGLVPQSAPMDYPFTVREVVTMGRYAHVPRLGGPGREDRERIDAALRRTQLVPLADRAVTALSGGERQRVLIARVLAQAPSLYLFDEPTANLDLGQAHRVLGILRAAADAGAAVVAVVHDLSSASALADRIVLLGEGRVVAEGPPRAVLTAERLGPVFGARLAVDWDQHGARVRVVAGPEL